MNSSINTLLTFEEQLIFQEINREFLKETSSISKEELELINADLLLTNDKNIAFNIHKNLVYTLINHYLNTEFYGTINLHKNLFYLSNDAVNINPIINLIEVNNIPQLVENLHITFLNSQFSINSTQIKRVKSKHYLKEFGAVYTLEKITNEIVSKTIGESLNNATVQNIKCLDFASGTGRFYFEAIKVLQSEYSLSLKNIICNNLYAIDIDEVALAILKCKIISLFNHLDNEIIFALRENIIHRNALIPNTSLYSEFKNNIDFEKDFKLVLENGGFDSIFSNPPYYLLKVNKNKNPLLDGYFNSLQEKIKKEISFFKSSGVYHYSIEGMLNYYQLSIEMILKLTKKNGQIGIICPASIFADLTSSKLRKHLLSDNKLHFIRYYPEASNLFDNVAQSTVIFYLEKKGITDKIKVELENNSFNIDYTTIKSIFTTNQEIPLIDEIGWSILAKISSHNKLKNYKYLRNKRGELDLTLYKECIIKNSISDYRLVRGNMITANGIIDKNQECVDIHAFINKKSPEFKEYDFNTKRLICQQISNIDAQKRLKFTFCETTDILANSCNYINSSRGSEDLDKLYFILNSELLNWRFKVSSSNNHINNYELNELPIINLDKIYLSDFTENNETNDLFICRLYGLNTQETNYILKKNKKIKKQILIVDEITL